MNKSILVIDTPTRCRNCDALTWCSIRKKYYCVGANRYIDSEDEKQKWCPLKELPRKRGNITLTERTQDIGMLKWALETKLVSKGYNECIDDILGGKEE